VHLVVAVKVYKEPSSMQQATGIEQLYKQDYYNKVFNKHKEQDNKIYKIK
jgi:hypothetical protein